VPGFVEIDLVGHEGGNAMGEHAYTLTVTDIATGPGLGLVFGARVLAEVGDDPT